MSWQILAVLSVITLSVATLLARVMIKKDNSDPIGYAIIFQFVLGFISLLFALAFQKFRLPVLNPTTVSLFTLSAVLWAGSTVFSFEAIKKLNAGETTILTSSSSLISILLSFIFLRERLIFQQIVGVVLILLAIFIVTTEKLSFGSRKAVIFALLSATCAGIAIISDALILKTYEAFSYVAIMSFLPGVVLLFIFPRHINSLQGTINRKFIFTIFVLCFFYSLQAITYYAAYQSGAPIAQLSPLIRTTVVLTVILAAVFLKERSYLPRKLLAAVVVMIGVILLG